MTLSLVLTRHAKSSWGDPTQEDIERPLNGRGRRSAVALGEWIRSNGYLPDEVLVSTARRSAETWSRMAKAMPKTAIMRSEPALYLASSDTMMRVLQTATAQTIMMVGHNPGICDFAQRLVSKAPDHSRFADYPTGATTVISFDATGWNEIGWSQGTTQAFVIPKELKTDQ